jgi:hypothetical protein
VYLADRDAESSSPIPPDVSHQPCDAVPLSLMAAVSATGPGMGLQSRWYRQHRSPHTPIRRNRVKPRFHPALTR